jgi:hypothetical protein
VRQKPHSNLLTSHQHNYRDKKGLEKEEKNLPVQTKQGNKKLLEAAYPGS